MCSVSALTADSEGRAEQVAKYDDKRHIIIVGKHTHKKITQFADRAREKRARNRLQRKLARAL